MKSNDENRKDKAVAWGVTIVAMGLMLALLLACSLKTQIPPPPPKKMVYIDIAPTGGGGGGGTPDAAPRAKTPSGRNVATQNAQDAPSVKTRSTRCRTTCQGHSHDTSWPHGHHIAQPANESVEKGEFRST